jgi:hypothetical protein
LQSISFIARADGGAGVKNELMFAIAVAAALAGCQKADNPLVSASDGQFARLVEQKNAFSPSCAAALYEPESFIQQYNALKFSPNARIGSISEQQKADCVGELQKRASEVGIPASVSPEHLRDDRVRQRYLAVRKK